MRMQEIDIHDYARQLLDAHGDKAVVEAAQKARALEQQGESEQAETWRHIEAALKLMRGGARKLTPGGSGPILQVLCSAFARKIAKAMPSLSYWRRRDNGCRHEPYMRLIKEGSGERLSRISLQR